MYVQFDGLVIENDIFHRNVFYNDGTVKDKKIL